MPHTAPFFVPTLFLWLPLAFLSVMLYQSLSRELVRARGSVSVDSHHAPLPGKRYRTGPRRYFLIVAWTLLLHKTQIAITNHQKSARAVFSLNLTSSLITVFSFRSLKLTSLDCSRNQTQLTQLSSASHTLNSLNSTNRSNALTFANRARLLSSVRRGA